MASSVRARVASSVRARVQFAVMVRLRLSEVTPLDLPAQLLGVADFFGGRGNELRPAESGIGGSLRRLHGGSVLDEGLGRHRRTPRRAFGGDRLRQSDPAAHDR